MSTPLPIGLFKVELGVPLDPVPQPIGYPGGKSRMAETILKHAPKHSIYVEPMAGGASVFFTKKPAKVNVLSDKDSQLVDFFRNFSCPKLKRCVEKNPATLENRKKFVMRFRSGSSDTCDYFMARRVSFNSNGKDVNLSHKSTKVGKKIASRCEAVADRLKKAKILNEDYRKVAKKYDRPGVFQYWDPPYQGRAKGLYKFEEGVSPEEVCGLAKSMKHAKVLITHYDKPEVRKACAGLFMKSVPYTYVSRTRNHGKVHRVRELFIANYPLS